MPGSTPTPADLLLTGAYVLTMDGANRVFNPGAVAIQGGRIAAVGPDDPHPVGILL